MSEAAGGSPLQFDTLVPRDGGTPGAAPGPVLCHNCSQPIASLYYDVSGQTTCSACRTTIATLLATPAGMGPLLKAGLFGLGAGIAGAILYYAVIAITNFEIGIVAIAIGYMVGYAVRKGAGGGGRRFQVLAVALTYAAVALAYTPLAVKGAMDAKREEAPSSAAASTAAETPAPETSVSPVLAIVFLVGLIAALPVLVIVGSLPSGLISAAIIFFGMAQAWKMTGTPAIAITGPYRVGAGPVAAA
jgi:hypothetical protein